MSNGIIFSNKILDVVFISVFLAQVFKIFSPVFKLQKPDFSKIFSTGGMPSSHSASMVSLCTAIYMVKGANSIDFAIAFVLAIVVMYDATGIRREAGKHAKMLNAIIFDSSIKIFETQEFKEFKEFLGHSPFEVLMGALLGIAIPVIFKGYLV